MTKGVDSVPWLPWVLATSLGWAIGWYVGANFYGETFGGLVSGGLGGSLGWIGQGAVLSVIDRRLGLRWAVSSVMLWLGGLGLGMAVTTFFGLHPTLVAIGLALSLTAIGQWLLLRSRYRQAGWWPTVLLLGVIVGGAAVSLVRLASGSAMLGALGGMTIGAGIGMTTGLVFPRLEHEKTPGR